MAPLLFFILLYVSLISQIPAIALATSRPSLKPNVIRAQCQFSRPNLSLWACSLQSCPVLVQLSNISPPRPQFNFSINQYHMLPIPLANISRLPSSRFLCFGYISSPRHQPHVIHLSLNQRTLMEWNQFTNSLSVTWSIREKKGQNTSTIIIIVVILSGMVVCLPLLIFLRLNPLHWFYLMYKFAQRKIFPCLPAPPEPRNSQSLNPRIYHRPYHYFYLRQDLTMPETPENVATSQPQSPPSSGILHSPQEIDDLISSATLSEKEVLQLRQESWLCCICLEESADQDIAQLSCGHSTHAACIRLWLTKGSRHVCCLCNAPASSASSVHDDFSSSDVASTESSHVGRIVAGSEYLDDTQSYDAQLSLNSLNTIFVAPTSSMEHQEFQFEQTENSINHTSSSQMNTSTNSSSTEQPINSNNNADTA